MSKWERVNLPFVWTAVDGVPYQLIGLNHSDTGIYINYRDSHYSFHTSGQAHFRSNEWKHSPESTPNPFTNNNTPPLQSISSYWLGSHWISVHPEAVRGYGSPIDPSLLGSTSIYLDPAVFIPVGQPVIEIALYDDNRRAEWDARTQFVMGHIPGMEFQFHREYKLDFYNKNLGVFVYRMAREAPSETEGEGETNY